LIVNVAAGTAGATTGTAPNAASSANQPNDIAATSPALPQLGSAAGAAQPWRAFALAALGLWLLTVLVWIGWTLARRKAAGAAPLAAQVQPADATTGAARKAFAGACKRNDAAAIARALLVWARSERSAARNLGELAPLLGDDAQRAALRDLERSLYAAVASACDGERIAAAFRNGFAFAPNLQAETASPLAPLYPFSIRADRPSSTIH
jgi:hypothetical protein